MGPSSSPTVPLVSLSPPPAFLATHRSNSRSYGRLGSSDDVHRLSLNGNGFAGGDGEARRVSDSPRREEEELGDVGLGELDDDVDRERRRKQKGKGKAVATDDEEDTVHVDEEDERREEARVAENLAKWSANERSRRADQRRTSSLVLPSNPIPGAVDLTRRGSKLLRSASQRSRRTHSRPRSSTSTSSEPDSIQLRKRAGSASTVDSSRTVTASSPTLPTVSEDAAQSPDRPPLVPSHSSSRFIEDLPSTPRHSQSLDENPFSDRAAPPSESGPPLSPPQKPWMIFNPSSSPTLSANSLPSSDDDEEDQITPTSSRRTAPAAASRLGAGKGEEEEDVDGGVSWVDWLLCGCFGSERGEDEGLENGGRQEGRTNPME